MTHFTSVIIFYLKDIIIIKGTIKNMKNNSINNIKNKNINKNKDEKK